MNPELGHDRAAVMRGLHARSKFCSDVSDMDPKKLLI